MDVQTDPNHREALLLKLLHLESQLERVDTDGLGSRNSRPMSGMGCGVCAPESGNKLYEAKLKTRTITSAQTTSTA